MKTIILLIAAILLTSCGFERVSGEYRKVDKKLYTQWKEKPKSSEKYEKSLLAQVTKIGEETRTCYEGLKNRVTLIVEINKAGENSGAWSDRSSDVTACMKNIAMGVKYPKPPFEPFYMKIILNVHEWPEENS
jgi:hypothetical protein